MSKSAEFRLTSAAAAYSARPPGEPGYWEENQKMNLETNQVRRSVAGLIAGALALAMLFVVGGVSAAAASGSDGVSAPGTVAKNPAGKMKPTIEGKTSGGGTLGAPSHR